MKNYYYNIYGYIVKTNIKIPLLKEVSSIDNDITIKVNFDEIEDSQNTISVKKENYLYRMRLSNLAIIDYDIRNSILYYTARDYQAFFSTLFNIPFSIICIQNDELLLHTSTLIDDSNNLLCIAADKGGLSVNKIAHKN